MLIAFEVEDKFGDLIEWEMEIDPTQEDVIEYYDTLVDEEIYENDDDFFDWLKDKYSDVAQDDYNEAVEEQKEYDQMAIMSHYW